MDWRSRVRDVIPIITGDARRDADIQDELAQHLADRERDLLAAGLPAADVEATVNTELTLAALRRRRLGRAPMRFWQEVRSDIRYGARLLIRSRGFSFVAIATLALAIGATTAIFSVVRGVLLRPLPYPEPARVVFVWEVSPEGDTHNVVSPANYLDWRERATSFSAIGALTHVADRAVTGSGHPIKIEAASITPSVLDVLGVPPLHGRRFSEQEGLTNAPQVAILSHGFWQRQFGGEISVIGQTLTLDDLPATMVGVMPPGFAFPSPDVDVLTNLTFSEAQRIERRSHNFMVIARLKAGAPLASADAEMAAVAEGLAAEYPQHMTGWSTNVVPIHADAVRNVRPQLMLMMGVALAVLLIACANLANLQLARSAQRFREMAVRAAIGAGGARMLRQMLTETVLLASIGGAFGVALAMGLMRLMVAAASGDIPFMERVQIDWVVLAAAAAATTVSAVVIGLAPAHRVSRADLWPLLQTARVRLDPSQQRLRQALVIAQVGVALVLLVAAGLLVRSFWHLNRVDEGYDSSGVLAVSVDLPRARYPGPPEQLRFYEQLFERLGAHPSISAAAGTTALPGEGAGMTFSFAIDGRPSSNPTGRENPVPLQGVTPDYFAAMRISIVRGRGFTAADRPDVPPVVVISQALARRHWPDGDAVGTRINFRPGQQPWREIVGIAGDTRDEGIAHDAPPTIYVPFTQREPNWTWMSWQTLLVRARNGEAEALVPDVRSTLWSLDPNLPLLAVSTVDELLGEQEARRRMAGALLVAFAILATLLATIGVYGVMSYSVSEQRQEIGIRLALGATPSMVASAIVLRGLLMAAAGVLVGLGTAALVTRSLETLLFEVEPTDPATFAATAVLLLAVAALAAWLPARRAMRVDPIIVMRDT